MNKTILQVPVSITVRKDAEKQALEQVFSSLQEAVRVFFEIGFRSKGRSKAGSLAFYFLLNFLASLYMASLFFKKFVSNFCIFDFRSLISVF